MTDRRTDDDRRTDGRTKRQTDTARRHRPRLCIAPRGKNGDFRTFRHIITETAGDYCQPIIGKRIRAFDWCQFSTNLNYTVTHHFSLLPLNAHHYSRGESCLLTLNTTTAYRVFFSAAGCITRLKIDCTLSAA